MPVTITNLHSNSVVHTSVSGTGTSSSSGSTSSGSGAQGAQGAVGPQGAPGLSGDDGYQGYQGIPGVQGDIGYQGGFGITEIEFIVTVNAGKYFIDGIQQPTLKLLPNFKYKFNLSDSSNSGHTFSYPRGQMDLTVPPVLM